MHKERMDFEKQNENLKSLRKFQVANPPEKISSVSFGSQHFPQQPHSDGIAFKIAANTAVKPNTSNSINFTNTKRKHSFQIIDNINSGQIYLGRNLDETSKRRRRSVNVIPYISENGQLRFDTFADFSDAYRNDHIDQPAKPQSCFMPNINSNVATQASFDQFISKSRNMNQGSERMMTPSPLQTAQKLYDLPQPPASYTSSNLHSGGSVSFGIATAIPLSTPASFSATTPSSSLRKTLAMRPSIMKKNGNGNDGSYQQQQHTTIEQPTLQRRGAICESSPDRSEAITKWPKSNETYELLQKCLSSHVMFNDMDSDSKRMILDAAKMRRYAAGEVIFRQGQIGEEFYMIEAGECDFYKRDDSEIQSQTDQNDEFDPFHFNQEENTHLCTVYPGSSFGEFALICPSDRPATVVAKTDCIMWVLNRDIFRQIKISKEFPEDGLSLSSDLFGEFADSNSNPNGKQRSSRGFVSDEKGNIIAL